MKPLHTISHHVTTKLPRSRTGEVGVLSVLLIVLSSVYIAYLNGTGPELYPLVVEGIALRVIFGGLCLFAVAILLPSDDRLPSTAALIFVYIFLYIPTILYYIFSNGDLIFTVSVAISILVAIILLQAVPPISIRQIVGGCLSRFVALIAMASMILIVLAGLFVANGIPSIDPLLYQNTYQIRESMELPRILAIGYMLNWVPKVILPFLAVYFWYKDWLWPTVAVAVLSVIIYMFSPQKLFIAALPFVSLVLYLSRRNRLLSGLTAVSISVIVAGYALGTLTDTVALAYLPSARLFFIQGRGQYLYVDFFKLGNPHLWLTTTPLNPGSSPYSQPVSYLVSGEFLGDPHNMNSGIFADAYAHADLLGVIALGPLLAGTGRLLDGVARRSDWRLVLAASATPLFMLTQVGFTIALATNGILFAIVLGTAFTSLINPN